MVGNLIHRKTDNTIIKKTNNGWQHHTQKNRQYNYKKRQTLVGNLIHRKTDNTITIVCLFYNCIVCFSVHDVPIHCFSFL
jgi:hypothetical protein